VLGFPERQQRASPLEKPAAPARLARRLKAPHLLQLLLRQQGRPRRESHLLAEHRPVRVRPQKDLALRHHLAGGRVRAPPLENSAVREPDQGKPNPRAVEAEKSAAQEPDREKQNPRAAALNFRENPLGQRGNLHPKQQVRVKEPGKEHKRGLIGSQRGPRVRLPRRDLNSKNSRLVVCADSLRRSDCARGAA
jgi:hypothetical protein